MNVRARHRDPAKEVYDDPDIKISISDFTPVDLAIAFAIVVFTAIISVAALFGRNAHFEEIILSSIIDPQLHRTVRTKSNW
jgi:hypothetical protein